MKLRAGTLAILLEKIADASFPLLAALRKADQPTLQIGLQHAKVSGSRFVAE